MCHPNKIADKLGKPTKHPQIVIFNDGSTLIWGGEGVGCSNLLAPTIKDLKSS